jgi:hypothetical protein
VSAPLRGAKKAPKTSAARPAADGALFAYELRREGRPVALLRGTAAEGVVTVETSIYSVNAGPSDPPMERPFRFTSPEAAQRFADETVLALEYLDCDVVE